jgi:DNA end-binding protein Ku
MKSIWSGGISLSFLNVPVALGSRTQDAGPELHQARRQDGSRIKFKRVSESDFDGPEVPYRDVVKSYAAPDGSLVLLEPEELKRAHEKTIGVITFTDASDVPPLAAKTAYWAQPGKEPGAGKAYALLAHSLQASGKVAIVKFAMRENMTVAVLRSVDGYLAVEPLEFDSNLVTPDFAAPENTATEADQGLMLQMIESMSGKYDHAAQPDVNAEAIMAVVQRKLENGEVREAPLPPVRADAGAPADLTAMLRASVDAQKAKTEVKPAKRAPAPRRRATPGKVTA